MSKQVFTSLGAGMSGTCLVSAEETAQTHSLFHIRADQGATVPAHVHQNEDEAFFIKSGTFTLQVGERLVHAEPGGVHFGPRGIPHGFTCTSAQGELLVMTLPGGFEAFFTELEAFGPLPQPPSMADLERFFALLGRYGMSPAAPLPQSTPLETLSAPAFAVFDSGDQQTRPLVLSTQTDGSLFVLEVRAACGAGIPMHVHEQEDETFVVLEGRFTIERGDASYSLGPGDCAFGPRGVRHAWRCDSADGGRLLVYVTPGANFEAFLGALARRFPKDFLALARLAQIHDITML